MLAWISLWHSSVLAVILVDAEAGVECLHNEGVFVALAHHCEALRGVVCEGVDDEVMIVGGHCQSLGCVLQGNDTVVNVGLGDKVLGKLGDLGDLVDLGNLRMADLVCGYDVPDLMGDIFPVPLDDVGAGIGDASVDGEALSLGEGPDGVALGYFFHNEPAALVLAWVSPEFAPVLLLVLADAQCCVVGLHHKGELISLGNDGEALRGIVCEGIDDEALVEVGHCQRLLGILRRNNAVVNVRLRHEALSHLEVSKTLHKQKYQQDISRCYIANIYHKLLQRIFPFLMLLYFQALFHYLQL